MRCCWLPSWAELPNDGGGSEWVDRPVPGMDEEFLASVEAMVASVVLEALAQAPVLAHLPLSVLGRCARSSRLTLPPSWTSWKELSFVARLPTEVMLTLSIEKSRFSEAMPSF